MAVPADGAALSLAAPAKINLTLEIVGRRADGYHLLDSLIAFASVGDVLHFAPAEELALAIEGPFAAALGGADNLVLRAARALAQAAGVAPRARIVLDKRLPVASGIGGGSADAACALKGLAALWRLAPDAADLAALAAGLGADVPVCLYGAPALVSGVGEIVCPAPSLPPVPLVLVNPLRPVETRAVFAARTGPFAVPAPLTRMPGDVRALARMLAARENGLAPAACAVEPAIADVLAALAAQQGCLLARLSGSGATCFALFPDAPSAARAARALAAARPAWWVRACRLLAPGEAPDIAG